jgi:FlaG/FlaF family flagellin (archaellin)
MSTPDRHPSNGGTSTDRRSSRYPRATADRALTPLTGVLVIALTVGLAAAASGAIFAATDVADATDDAPPRASLSLAVDDDVLSFTHRGGDALDVSRLRLVVAIDGERLARQPPVPFFSARGFHSGPTGPFNPASDPQWTAGETATLSVAGTNRPALSAGSLVTVDVYAGDTPVASLSARI